MRWKVFGEMNNEWHRSERDREREMEKVTREMVANLDISYVQVNGIYKQLRRVLFDTDLLDLSETLIKHSVSFTFTLCAPLFPTTPMTTTATAATNESQTFQKVIQLERNSIDR